MGLRVIKNTASEVLQNVARGLPNSVTSTLKDSGNDIIDESISNIEKQKRPDNSAQKRNKPSTIKQKGHSTPLVGKNRTFLKRGLYNLRVSSGKAYMMAPQSHWEIINYLRQDGYEFWYLPKTLNNVPLIQAITNTFIKYFNKSKQGH